MHTVRACCANVSAFTFWHRAGCMPGDEASRTVAVSVVSYLSFGSAGAAFPERFQHTDGGTYRRAARLSSIKQCNSFLHPHVGLWKPLECQLHFIQATSCAAACWQ